MLNSDGLTPSLETIQILNNTEFTLLDNFRPPEAVIGEFEMAGIQIHEFSSPLLRPRPVVLDISSLTGQGQEKEKICLVVK